MLKIRNLVAGYGRIQVLKGISLHVGEGEIVTLIGANGAGKTALINAVSGLLRAEEGEILLGGAPIQGLPPERVVRAGVSQVPEGRLVFGPLSVEDNLRLGAWLRHRSRDRAGIESALAGVYQTFPLLRDKARQAAGTLSGGEQQMLAVGRALMAEPRLLLLDEPSLGLAPLVTAEIFRIIARLREKGVTILLVEQNARVALALADRGYVMETGTIVLSDRADRLLMNREVQRAYLGKLGKEIWEE
jgi:branched-chain amino acid transport system ATP-binding protein